MELRRATTCCGALALLLLSTSALAAPPKASPPLSLLPARQVWTVSLDKLVTAAPAFAGTRGFFGVDGDRVVAYDLVRGGEPLWTAMAHATAPLSAGGGLVFVVDAGGLTALAEDTGALVWRAPLTNTLAQAPVFDNGWLIGADASGLLLAFRASDGAPIWTRDLGVALHARPALAADRVYAALSDGRVVALAVTSGEPQWTRKLGGPPNDMLALDDRIYVGSDDNFLYCLEASDGTVAWRWRTGGDVIGMPVADAQRVYFVSLDNVLRGLDRGSGSQRWKQALPFRPTRGPVLLGDLLLVSGLTPKVSAFSVKDGKAAGEIKAEGELAAPPFASEQHGLPQLVLASRDIAHGMRLLSVRRTIDPPMDTPLPILPNPLTIAKPQGSTTTDATSSPNAPGTPTTTTGTATPLAPTGAARERPAASDPAPPERR